MRPDEILVHRVIARLNVGGPAMHVVHLAGGLDDGPPLPDGRRFRTRLVAGSIMETEGDMSYFAAERGVEVTTIPEMARAVAPLRDLRSFLALYRLFRRERPTIVHTHTSKAGALGRLAALLAGVPVRIHTYHGHVLGGDYFGPRTTRIFLAVERALARVSRRLLVLTPAQKREMAEDLGVAPSSKFEVVPLGLDLEAFAEAGPGAASPRGHDTARGGGRAPDRDPDPAPVAADVRRELGLGPHDAVVGIVGRMVPIKNHELLFDAAPRLRQTLEGPEGGGPRRLRILVIGSGEREDELRRYARGRGLGGDEVLWLGWRRDLTRLYPAMDVLALTSRDEGTPVAVMEALAARVPVVARDVGGVAAVLDGGELGRLVEREDPDELAAALADALRSPPSAEKREAASRSVRRRFGVERLVDDVRRLYVEELEELEGLEGLEGR